MRNPIMEVTMDPRTVTINGRTMFRVAGAEGPPAAPAEPAVEPVAPESEPGPAPWTEQLTTAFEDEDQRTAVDGFLREHVQPYVTRLEQDRPPAEAASLWQDFTDAPEDTLVAVFEEIYGEDAGAAFEAWLDEQSGEGTPPPPAGEQPPEGEPVEPGTPQYAELSPEDREAVDAWRAGEDEKEFTSDVKGLVEANKGEFPGDDVEKAKRLIAPFVVTAEGDLEAAFEAYKLWAADLSPAEQAAAVEGEEGEITPEAVAGGAPPALGGAGGGNPAVPAQKDYKGDLGAAVEDFMAEERAKRAPPPVGGV